MPKVYAKTKNSLIKIRDPDSISSESRERKRRYDLLSCETCGQFSRLIKGMCKPCIEKYSPKDFFEGE